MKISEIKIKQTFKHTNPSEEKMKICRTYFNEYGKLDRDIVVDKNGFLCDGYVGYLVLVENGIDEVEVVCNQSSENKNNTYVFAYHSGSDKEYVWKVPKKIKSKDINNGSNILVQTRFGIKAVTATRIETLSTPPITTPQLKR